MRHAYLILAHDNFYTLEKLISLLDESFNDIYIHIDKKVNDFNKKKFENLCKKSKVFFVDRIKVYWGTYSQIDAQMILLKAAIQNNYDYYHFLSGSDLPIKSQHYIYDFFLTHKGKEFLGFANDFNYDYISKKFYFVKYFKHKNKLISKLAKKTSFFFVNCQKQLNVDNAKKINLIIKKGTDWYSITHNASMFLLKKESIFKKFFNKAIHPGEFFAHTVLFNSYFRENIYNLKNENLGSLRFIDWERGNPYVFRKSDFNNLINSPLLFARKFHENVDKEIINEIFNYIKKDKK